MFIMDITQDEQNIDWKKIVWLVLANIMVALYFLSPFLILRSHHTERMQIKFLPLFQVISVLLNCLFWIISYLPDGEMSLESILESLIINTFGLFTGIGLLFYCWVKSYSENSCLFISILNVCHSFFQIAIFIHFYTQTLGEENQGKLITQIIACIFNVLMYVSLLQNPFLIYFEKKYQKDFLPLDQLYIGLLSTGVWIIYGMVKDDRWIIIPNSIGLFFLIIILIFCIIIKKVIQKNERIGLNSIISEVFVSQSPIETDTQG